MGIFGFGKSKEQNKLKTLLNEKKKQDKKIEKDWENRLNNKYTVENLKMAKKDMIYNAMTIDSTEYEKISKELKERLNHTNKE